MATKILSIPNDLKSMQLAVGDDLKITVTEDCTWCYAPSPTDCFDPPPDGFLAAGYYAATTPPTTYGSYTAIAAGTIQINSVPISASKRAGGPPVTAGHSITVS